MSSELSYRVIDSINHRQRDGHPEPAGVILVLDRCRPNDLNSLIGLPALVRTSIGMIAVLPIAAVRDHGITISILVGGLTRDQVPIGSTVSFVPDPSQGLFLSQADLGSIRLPAPSLTAP